MQAMECFPGRSLYGPDFGATLAHSAVSVPGFLPGLPYTTRYALGLELSSCPLVLPWGRIPWAPCLALLGGRTEPCASQQSRRPDL